METAQDDGTSTATGLRWCSRCGQPVEVDGDGPLAKAVHKATGREQGYPDGHVAAPLDFEPLLWRHAREIKARYGGVFDVTARLGILRADWADPPAGAVVQHYTGRTPDELTAKLDAALRAAW
jgi:hypothetical protein